MRHVVQFLCMTWFSIEKYIRTLEISPWFYSRKSQSDPVYGVRRARSIVVIPALPFVHLNSARGCPSHRTSIAGGVSGTQLDVLSIVVISPRCSDFGVITKKGTQVVAREMMP